MASGPRYSVKFRRRREGKTDYKGRLALLMGKTPRLVVRRTARAIIIQFIDFSVKGDKVLGTARSTDLKSLGWKYSTKSLPAAYLTGLLAAKRSVGKVKKAVLDIGQHRPRKGARVFAAMMGVIDGGIKIPHGDSVLPSEDRVKGAHIEANRNLPVPAEFERIKQTITGLKDGKVPSKKKAPPRPAPKPVAKPAPKPAAKPAEKPAPKPAPVKKKSDDLDDLLKDLTSDDTDKKKPKSALEALLKKRKQEKED